jgi:hypothetical protein
MSRCSGDSNRRLLSLRRQQSKRQRFLLTALDSITCTLDFLVYGHYIAKCVSIKLPFHYHISVSYKPGEPSLQLSWHKHRLYYRNMTQLRQVTLAGLRYKMQLCWSGIPSVSHLRTASPPYSCVLLNNVHFQKEIWTHMYRNSIAAITFPPDLPKFSPWIRYILFSGRGNVTSVTLNLHTML